MIKTIILGLTTLLVMTTLPATEKDHNALAVFYTLEGNAEKAYNTLAEKKLETIGFNLVDPHKRVNDHYEAKWGSTTLDLLSFMPIVNDEVILPLLNIDPRIAGFAPFNLLVYKKLTENKTHVGHLMPKVMLDILGISDEEVRKKFTDSFNPLDSTIEKELGGEVSYIPYKKLADKTMINFEYDFERPEDLDDFIDEFQNKFSLSFIKKGYLIAGYHDFMYSVDDADEILSEYDAFWTYSLCHLEFSYNVFDNNGARPDAGLFAPCTMYMYIKKDTSTVVIGMLRLQNWASTLNITDTKRLELIQRLDTQIPEILTAMGMRSVPNGNPLKLKNETNKPKTSKVTKVPVSKAVVTTTLPTVPKAISVVSVKSKVQDDRSIKFSKRVPPNYVPHSFDKRQKNKTNASTNIAIGQVNSGRISAHLRGEYIDIDTVKKKLETAGFTVLSEAPVNKKGTLVSVVFTSDALLSMASSTNKGFMGTLRVLVDTKEKYISITNPLYLTKSFLQDTFDEEKSKDILEKIVKEFPVLRNSKDALKFQALPSYKFMKGMPTYDSMIEVANGENLLEKLKDNKKVVFTQLLKNGSTLVGIQLSKRTRKFTKRIGRNNAGMLPYPILIEDGKAKILNPKYYIAIMYPSLTMSQFMTIATIPDAMIRDCQKVFK